MQVVNTLMRPETFASGQFPDSNPIIVVMAGASLPSMLQLASASTTRRIEVSADNMLTWEQPPPDVATTTKLAVRITAPITHTRFTGVASDKYAVL